MEDRSAVIRARPLRLRLPDPAYTKLSDIAVREDRTVERQAERLLRQAIDSAADHDVDPAP
jgi:hypothetical protein